MGLFEDLAKNTKLGLQPGSIDFWNTTFVRSGIPPIDWILGGGAAIGRILEMFGNESSGKSLILYKLFIENTKNGGVSILYESEGAFNPEFFASLGGDPAKLLVKPAETVEDVFNDILDLADQKIKNKEQTNVVVGWDSVAATPTKHLLKEGMDKVDMTKAKMISQGFQLVTNKIKKASLAVVVINQTRQSIGTNDSGTVTPGGRALPFAGSQRLELRYDGGSRTSLILQDPDDKASADIGRKILCRVVKNKVAAAWRECVLPFYSYEGLPHPKFEGHFTTLGIDVEEALFDFYLAGHFLLPNKQPVVRAAGSWNKLASVLDPAESSWYAKDWRDILELRPDLLTLVYDDLSWVDVAGTQPIAIEKPENLPTPPEIS